MGTLTLNGEFDNLLSPSSLKLKIRCGKLYEYEKILKLPKEEDETALLFGRMTHSILEHFYSNVDDEEAKNDAYTHFSEIVDSLKQRFWDFNIPQKLESDLDEILQNFVLKQSATYSKLLEKGKIDRFYPLSTEREILSKKYNVRCIIDCVNKNNTISDYKTNKEFPEILLKERSELTKEEKIEYDKERLDYEIQAMMNALCYEDEYGKFPTMMLYIFVRHLNNKVHGGLLPIFIDQELADKIIPLINKHTQEINNGIFKRTTNLQECNKFKGCPYKEQCNIDNMCWYFI